MKNAILLVNYILGPCQSLPRFIANCYYDYSSDKEDKTPLSLPGWNPLPNNTSWSSTFKLCPKPWRYQNADEINTYPIEGRYNSYEGGGYVASMGYDEETALEVLLETLGHGWIDRQTRAIILEFTVFNINTNLLSIATYFYEVQATGVASTATRVNTLEFYSTDSGAVMFYYICQFLFMAMVLYRLIMVLIHLYKLRLEFFKFVWNVVELLMIVFSLLAVAFYMIRSKSVLKTIQSIQSNPYEILHFHEALGWTIWENVAVSMAIFMVTVKLLNLIRFDPFVIFLFSSFRQSVGYQLSHFFIFLIMFNAFVVSGKQFFGHTSLDYSSYMNAVVHQFEYLLGRAVPLDDLRRENPFLGPVFAFAFNIAMTLLILNLLISVLNESYTAAKTQAEESAEELKMARFIGERLSAAFGNVQRKTDFRLYCDESAFGIMCYFEAEPFCVYSESLVQGTEERMEVLDKRIAALARKTQWLEADYEPEVKDFGVYF